MSATPANEFDRHSTNSKEEGEDKLITTRDLEEQPKTEIDKLGGYDLWKNMGEPKYVVAPMVDQSELVRTTLPARKSRFAAEILRFCFSLTLESLFRHGESCQECMERTYATLRCSTPPSSRLNQSINRKCSIYHQVQSKE